MEYEEPNEFTEELLEWADKKPNNMEQIIKVCNMVQQDIERDMIEFDKKPFDGKTVATLFGYQAAAISALAEMIKTLAREGQKK